ncbi:hypothetical protein R69658_07665 [Paraburkholderia aspalathi]|uniref:Extended Signal Peptide of Type V secretion system n=1 Tax=Paraburkholderia aspalathi TaxID=1324617 RepID=A0ABM8T6F4_9BURK|nr:hypothetical protein [Paraburkholderia aspalathi]MBK3823961.1 hypothetical protein [Paraburkholderia aspalathi]MBK3835802.1 hypothetical protein [Paraburkholderia aspalathi]MBK3865595.1 hypothetical protein [Paraburkholderia aspalathi]CAE6862049.1 hypothetical protein R69658_07665 [Paraburkholderia aspalathi]
MRRPSTDRPELKSCFVETFVSKLEKVMKKTFVQGSNTGASSASSRFAVGRRKLLAAALLAPLVAFAQSYPSPTFNNLTVQGTFTLSGGVPPASLAAQAANTVLANVTASSHTPTAVAIPSCSAAGSALNYTSGTGLGCATGIALTGVSLAQFAATTSAQLQGVVSDETGSGSLVFGTSVTSRPNLGFASRAMWREMTRGVAH